LPSDIQEIIVDDKNNEVYEDALIVFNHSMDYESYFKRYQDIGVAFGAIHLSDETLADSVDFYKYDTCQFVIRNYHHPIHSLRYNVITIGLGCKQGYYDCLDSELVQSTRQRYYHWCFAGNLHDRERLHAIKAFLPMIPYKLHTTTDGFNSKQSLSTKQYAEWLQESKFAICPVGQGNIDSFRFYEACEAGAIPVVLGNTHYQQYPSSYWHYIFPMYQDTTFPFIIAKDWHDACEQMQALLMQKEKYEEMHKHLCIFWKDVKQYWKHLITKLL
jgi:hypothetical protein